MSNILIINTKPDNVQVGEMQGNYNPAYDGFGDEPKNVKVCYKIVVY